MKSRMKSDHQRSFNKIYLPGLCLFLTLLLSSCAAEYGPCYQQPYADLSQVLTFAENDQLEFQFPLDDLGIDATPKPAKFCAKGYHGDVWKYHAAEDYHLPAGSPVYAFAAGEISYSGRMDGYGWLIIIDHPQADIYSLYGHLSPSRWYLKSGPVAKGDLIGYLGDPDENGGSKKNPLVTHLHFGVRIGQRTDYSGKGEWRWMAGWIKNCPSDLGWMKPSAVISSQKVPPVGFEMAAGSLFEKWGFELFFSSIYIIAGVFILSSALQKDEYLILLLYGGFMIAAMVVFSVKSTRIQYGLIPMSGLAFGTAILIFIRGRIRKT